MTTKRKPTPYKIPTAWKGDTLAKSTLNWDAAFLQAVKELAAEETERWGSTHGVAVIITNVTLRNTNYFRDRRVRLSKRYNELKKQEKSQREKEQQEDQVAAEFS